MKLVASFGYRYGLPKRQVNKGLVLPYFLQTVSKELYIPSEEDFREIHDIRFLYGRRVDNPYHDPYLATLNGLHPDVQKAVYAFPGVLRFIEEATQRDSEILAVGCTAGRHRSVAIAEEIGRRTGAKVWHINMAQWPSK